MRPYSEIPDPSAEVPDPNGVYPDPFGKLLAPGIYTRLSNMALGIDPMATRSYFNVASDTVRDIAQMADGEPTDPGQGRR